MWRASCPTGIWWCTSASRMPSTRRRTTTLRPRRGEASRSSHSARPPCAVAGGVRVGLEVIPNALSAPAALTRLIEEELESVDAGVCLDYGHAHLLGDLAEAVETISGHVLSTHVHDNRGMRDDHLVPFA